MLDDEYFELYEGSDISINLTRNEDKATLTLHTWHGSSDVEISKELYDLLKEELQGKL